MDAYSSLLNLNFMASLRTGNLIVDMFIAILIPFISGLVAYLCQSLWPETVQWVIDQFKINGNRMYITQYMYGNETSSLDLNENVILREAVLDYVAHKLKPTYSYGNYQFQRLPVEGGEGNRSAAEVIQEMYSIRTIPKLGEAVDVAPGVRMTIEENEENNSDESKNNNNNNSNNNGGMMQKYNSPMHNRSAKMNQSIVLESLERGLSFTDAPLEFARTAFDWYRGQLHHTHDKNRYLYLPMLQSNGLLVGVGDGGEEDDRHVIKCQRYQLSLDKTFNTLFFPQKVKLMELIDAFESRTGKFAVPGFPHRLVLLLHGPPGTGKTSLVKAIAAYTRRHILSIDLSRVQTNRQLINYLYDGRFKIVNYVDPENPWREKVQTLHAKKVVYMLEDVDAACSLVVRQDDQHESNIPVVNTKPKKKTNSGVHEADEEEEAVCVNDKAKTQTENEQLEEQEEYVQDEKETSSFEIDDASSSSSKSNVNTTKEETCSQEESNEREHEDNVSISEHDVKEAIELVNTPNNSNININEKKNDESEELEEEEKKEEEEEQQQQERAAHNTKDKEVLVDRVTIKDSNRPRLLEASDKLSIKGILDAMGGILESPGRIIIMTTNHIDHLDPALLRPGVVTMKLHMGTFTATCALEMVEHYFANMKPHSAATLQAIRETVSAANSSNNNNNYSNNINDNTSSIMVKGFSPAEVEQMCAESESIEDLLQLLQRGSRTEVY